MLVVNVSLLILTRSTMQSRSSILIVEDQAIIGMALRSAVEHAGGDVIGPVASVKLALNLIETRPVSGAILDVVLSDGLVSPLVKCLQQRHIPMIIQTGVGYPAELLALFPDLIVKAKPTFSQPLVRELFALIEKKRRSKVTADLGRPKEG